MLFSLTIGKDSSSRATLHCLKKRILRIERYHINHLGVILYEVSYLPQKKFSKKAELQTLNKKNQQIKASKFLTRPEKNNFWHDARCWPQTSQQVVLRREMKAKTNRRGCPIKCNLLIMELKLAEFYLSIREKLEQISRGGMNVNKKKQQRYQSIPNGWP